MMLVLNIFVWLLLYQGFMEAFSDSLLVSHDGDDFFGCGNSSSPCATVRFAVKESRAGDVIHIDYDGGKPYQECSSPDSEMAILIEKSLSFVGRKGKAVLYCTQTRNLFRIIASRGTSSHFKGVLFENLVLGHAEGAISLEHPGTNLVVKDCVFQGNENGIVSKNSGLCTLSALNSVFQCNYNSGILVKCDSVRANLTSTVFNSSSVSLHTNRKDFPNKSMEVYISRSKFYVGCKRGQMIFSGVQIVYAFMTTVNVSIHDSSFTKQVLRDVQAPVLLIRNLGFISENRKVTWIVLDGLTFEDNKPNVLGVGVYEFFNPGSSTNFKVVNCIFDKNANGAVSISVTGSLSKEPIIVLENNSFTRNDVGATILDPLVNYDKSTVCLYAGIFHIISCNFTDNSLGNSSTSSVVYVNDNADVTFNGCSFQNSQVVGNAAQIYATPRSFLHFVGDNRFNMLHLISDQRIVYHTYNVMSVFHIEFPRITISPFFSVLCPKGFNIQDDASPFVNIGLYLFVSFSCKQCPLKTYSVERGMLLNRTNVSRIGCHSCPRGGYCEKGTVRAKPNFWGYEDKKQVSFISCPPRYCCTGDNCKSFDSCYGNRTGKLCGRCPNGMSETLFSTECKLTDDCKNYPTFWLVFVCLLVLYFLFFLFYKEISAFLRNGFAVLRSLQCRCCSRESNESQSVLQEDGRYRNESSGVGYLKIIFYFYQVVGVLKRGLDSNNNHGLLDNLRSLFTKTLNLVITNVHLPDCIPFQHITPVKKTVLLHSVAFCLLAFSVVTCLLWKLCQLVVRKRRVTSSNTLDLPIEIPPVTREDAHNSQTSNHSQTFSIRILCVFTHVSVLMYSSSAQLVFTLLQCVPFRNHEILFIDGTVQCYQPFQYFLIAYAVVSTLPFFLVPVLGSYVLMNGRISGFQFCLGCLFPLPFCCYWGYLLVKNGRSRIYSYEGLAMEGDDQMVMEDPTVHSRKAVLAVLSGPFRSHKRFLCFPSSHLPWEGFLIFRRLIIVSAFTFIYDVRLRMIVILIICVLILLFHSYVKPFANASENVAESLSLGALIILCGFTLVKALYHGEDYSSFRNSSELLGKFDLAEDILIIAPASFVALIAIICIFIKLVSLLISGVTRLFGKLRNLFNRAW